MTTSIPSGFSFIAADVPVDPDRDEAQKWIIEELSKPEYQAAQPTWWDRLSAAFWDWLDSLIGGAGDSLQSPLIAILLLVIAGAVIAAFLIFGKPRINRRSAIIGSLFGDDEERDAETLRRSANAAASRGEWDVAIEELFRSLARVLAERVLVSIDPGTTAHGFAQRAGMVFPDHASRLASSATAFDDVRYLGKPGTPTHYDSLASLERELRTASPPADSTLPVASIR